MATYNTQNPLGSSDPRDLYDNAENADRLINGADNSYPDRLGNARLSWAGIEDRFQEFLLNSGYQVIEEPYAAGIEVTTRNQIILAGGEYWRLSASAALPYTTTGAGMPESGSFVSVGDDVLRQELGDPTLGGELIHVTTSTGEKTLSQALDQRTIYTESVGELEAFSLPVGTSVYLTEEGRAGEFVVKSGTPPSDPQKGIYIPLANGNYAQRQYIGPADVKWFGAKGDGIVDDIDSVQAAIVACSDVLVSSGTYAVSTLVVQRPETQVVFSADAKIKLTAPIPHAWGFSGGQSKSTRLIGAVIDCNFQAGANGLGIGGSGIGTVQNVYVENPVVRNARRQPDSTATYGGGGRGMMCESDVENVQVIAPRFENCTAGFATQPYLERPTQGLLIVAPVAVDCMHYAEFFDLPDGGTVSPSGEMGGAVVLGGYAKNVGRGQSDYYSGSTVFDAATDTGAIMCERARWVNWTGFQIYNDASYGSIGSVIRGTGSNCNFEGTFAGDSNAITDITFSNMLLPIPTGIAVPTRNLQLKITHSGAYNYAHRYLNGSNPNIRGLMLNHKVYSNPATSLYDTTHLPDDAYIEWYNFSTGESFSGSLQGLAVYTVTGSARRVEDKSRINRFVALSPTTNPASPGVSNEGNIYIRQGNLVIQYNDAGTTRYKYLPLQGTSTTWIHSTTAP